MPPRKDATSAAAAPTQRRRWEKPRLTRMKATGAESSKIRPGVDGLHHS
jgi:hypothetical protein